MKRIVLFIIAILLGVGIGWYFGYTRPTVKNQRKLLREYQITRDNFQMTDAEMADFAEHRQEYFEAMKRQDEMAAAMALGALVPLERGDVEKAKSRLQTTISIYFRGHRQDGDSNVLRHITAFAATNAALSNAIYRRLE
ncbi:MAG: hypothetical protein U1F98_10895 [Verrucomicrobiota bacterium]